MSGIYHASQHCIMLPLCITDQTNTENRASWHLPTNLDEHANIFQIHVTQTFRSAYTQVFHSMNVNYTKKVDLDLSSYLPQRVCSLGVSSNQTFSSETACYPEAFGELETPVAKQ